MAKIEPIRKLNKKTTLTMEVKFTKEFKFRIWIATKLIQLASLVLGCKSKIVKSEEPPV